MFKKVIPLVVALCLIFGLCVMAENEIPTPEAAAPQISEQAPPPSKMQGEGIPSENANNGQTPPQAAPPQSGGNAPSGNPQFGGQMPGGMGGFPGNMQNQGQPQEEQPMGFLGFVKTYSTPITSVVLLGLAFVFVIFYRRKNY